MRAAAAAAGPHQRCLTSAAAPTAGYSSSSSRRAQGSISSSAIGTAPHARNSSMASSPTAACASASSGAASSTILPRLIAFDLDGTLWWPEMYMLSGGAPFRRDSTGAVHDAAGERIKLMGDSLKIVQQITMDPAWAETEIAYVSRTEYPEWAIPCLQQFVIPGHPQGLTLHDVGVYQEIYPGSKLKHFKVIHQESGVAYSDMLFFDNERWNVTEVSRLGVKSVYTPRGMTAAAWQEGLAMFDNGKKQAHKHNRKQQGSSLAH